MNEVFSIASKITDIAEHSTYLELTSRICYYDVPNLNNDMLPYDDTAEAKANTLVDMPVQARYLVNKNNEPTFGGHEMVKKKDGTIEFRTSSIGTHTEVWIENDDVEINNETRSLPCLFAKYRLWKRYPKMIAAARRLFDLGKLYSSWEIQTYEYIYNNGIRKITEYEFLSNCLLGFETSYPSYGKNANALSMASLQDNSQLLIAEALSEDLIDELNKKNGVKEDNILAETKKTTAQNTNNTVESAQLTVWDTRCKVSDACRAKIDKWCWVAYMFPNEQVVWCEYEGRETELDYVKFSYEVDENDTITVSEPEYVKLSVGIAEINTKIAEMEQKIKTAETDIDVKNETIIKANEKIQELASKIAELTPYKEAADVAEKERVEQEIAEEKKALRAKMLKGGLFTEAEIAKVEIAELIEARDKIAINGLIADRFAASFDTDDIEEEHSKTVNSIETATASLENDDEYTSVRSFMKSILFNK